MGEYLQRTGPPADSRAGIVALQEHGLPVSPYGAATNDAVSTMLGFGYRLVVFKYVAWAVRADLWHNFNAPTCFTTDPTGRISIARADSGLLLVNVYAYDHGSRKNRQEHHVPARALQSWLLSQVCSRNAGPPSNLALLGDLQDTITLDPCDNTGTPLARSQHSILTAALDTLHMTCSLRALHPTLRVTTRRTLGHDSTTGRRIDLVMLTPDLEPVASGVDTIDLARIVSSDHFPAWADMALDLTCDTTDLTPAERATYLLQTAGAQVTRRWSSLAQVPVHLDTGRCLNTGPAAWCAPPRAHAEALRAQNNLHTKAARACRAPINKILDRLVSQAAASPGLPLRCEAARQDVSRCWTLYVRLIEQNLPPSLWAKPIVPSTPARAAAHAARAARDLEPGFVRAPHTGHGSACRALADRLRDLRVKLRYVASHAQGCTSHTKAELAQVEWEVICRTAPRLPTQMIDARADWDTVRAEWGRQEQAIRLASLPADKKQERLDRQLADAAVRTSMACTPPNQPGATGGTRLQLPPSLAHILSHTCHEGAAPNWAAWSTCWAANGRDALQWLRTNQRRFRRKAKSIDNTSMAHRIAMQRTAGLMHELGLKTTPHLPPPSRTYVTPEGTTRPPRTPAEYRAASHLETRAYMASQGSPLPFARPINKGGVDTYEYNPEYTPLLPTAQSQPDPPHICTKNGDEYIDASDAQAAAARIKHTEAIRLMFATLRPKEPSAHLAWPFRFTQREAPKPVFSDPGAITALRRRLRGPVTKARHAGFHLQAIARLHEPCAPDSEASPANWFMDTLVRIIQVSLAYRIIPGEARNITRHPIPKPDGGERPLSVTHALYA